MNETEKEGVCAEQNRLSNERENSWVISRLKSCTKMIYAVLIFQLPKYVEVGSVLTIQIHFSLLVSADSKMLY